MTTRDTEAVQQIVEDIRRRALDVIGEDDVQCVFISGSVSRDEVVACEYDGRIEIYSDVDMGIVVSTSVNVQGAKDRLRAEMAKLPRETDSFCMYAPPDVGVYRVDELMAQTARPGTVNLGQATVVHGDADIVANAASSVGTDINALEALYLIENRLNECAEVGRELKGQQSPGQGRYAAYIGLKCCLDIATAVLIVLDQYRDYRSERMSAIEEPKVQAEMASMTSENISAEIRRCWQALQNLPGFFDEIAGRESQFISQTRRALAHSWEGVARHVYTSRDVSSGSLLRERLRYGKPLRNTRELLAVARRVGWGGPHLYRCLFALRMVSSVDLLRIASLLESITDDSDDRAKRFIESVCIPCLETLTHLGGITAGDAFERGRTLNRLIT